MKKRAYHIFAYKLPFREPVELRGVAHTHRSGLLLRLADEDGLEGWGEIAPLPGFSRESIADDARNGETVARLWCSKFPDALFSLRAPAIRFGLEQAAWQIEAVRAGLELHQMVAKNARDSIRINALLFGESREQLAKAIRSRLAGFKTVKIKVGRRAPEADAKLISELSQDLGSDVRIRLDANRGWSLDDAVRFGKMIRGLPIEFIEEPVSNPHALAAFVEKSGIPVALDETLMDQKPSAWMKIKGVAAVILKPTLLGGFKACVDLANQAVSIGAMPVISSTYESGVGTIGLAALAAFVTRPDDAAGLDAHWQLGEDVLKHRLEIVNGTLYLAGMRRIEVRTEVLKEIARG
jgi:O-succinylbenzoate synthase